MAVSFVGAASAGATSVTLPTHQVGDLIIIHAVGLPSDPTPPAGWTSPTNGNGNNSTLFGRVHYKLAASSSEVSGTWTNALILNCSVYRGTSGSIVACAVNTGSTGLVITYPALTLSTLAGTSWGARAASHGGATNIDTAALTGYTNRTQASNLTCIKDTNAAISANPTADAQTVTGSSAAWVAFTWELAIPGAVTDQHGLLAMF